MTSSQLHAPVISSSASADTNVGETFAYVPAIQNSWQKPAQAGQASGGGMEFGGELHKKRGSYIGTSPFLVSDSDYLANLSE